MLSLNNRRAAQVLVAAGHMFPPPKFRICSSIIIVVFAALLVGLLDRPAAHAQEDDRDFVDVGPDLGGSRRYSN